MSRPIIKVFAEDGSIIEEREMTEQEYAQFIAERDARWANA
jgi:hypothetical protein